MPDPIRTIRVVHLNIVHEDYDETVAHYQDLFGGMVVMDRRQPTWHACLIDIGRVLFEMFVPDEFFLHTRYGPALSRRRVPGRGHRRGAGSPRGTWDPRRA